MSEERVTGLYVEAALNALDYGYFDAFLPMFEDAIKRRKRRLHEHVPAGDKATGGAP